MRRRSYPIRCFRSRLFGVCDTHALVPPNKQDAYTVRVHILVLRVTNSTVPDSL